MGKVNIELQKAMGEAVTFSGSKPPGEYIGCKKTERTIFYYYKDGNAYWFETEYDRKLRDEEEKKKQTQCREYDKYMRRRYG